MTLARTAENLGDVLVLGLGKTGVDVARYLLGLGDRVGSVTVYGGSASTEGDASRELESLGGRVVLGSEDVEGSYDLAIASPGISEFCPFFLSARDHAREIIGEPEFAWRESPRDWVAITGSNGKTTTTSLTTALLHAAGRQAVAVGNIGNLCTDEVSGRVDGEWFVAELSSFQLATTRLLHPRVAALLNVTPDHVEWHGSLEAYAQAKEKIFQNLDGGDLAVLYQDDEYCRGVAARLATRGVRTLMVSATVEPEGPDAAFVRDGVLVVRLAGRESELSRVEDLTLKGTHNVVNALFSCAMALELGCDARELTDALQGFQALEHRNEPVATVDGVLYVNDSKATNTDSVEKALVAYEAGHVIVLLGGHDKGTDLASLSRLVARHCKAAVCFGAAGERIARAVEDAAVLESSNVAVIRAPHLREAFDAAHEAAREGDVVLLSPACSSFDEFRNMAERGRVFKGLVAGLSDSDKAEL